MAAAETSVPLLAISTMWVPLLSPAVPRSESRLRQPTSHDHCEKWITRSWLSFWESAQPLGQAGHVRKDNNFKIQFATLDCCPLSHATTHVIASQRFVTRKLSQSFSKTPEGLARWLTGQSCLLPRLVLEENQLTKLSCDFYRCAAVHEHTCLHVCVCVRVRAHTLKISKCEKKERNLRLSKQVKIKSSGRTYEFVGSEPSRGGVKS